MRQKLRANPGADPYPASGRGYLYVCSQCGELPELRELKDGDQAYWCPHCQRGQRAGAPPRSALRREAGS